MDEMDEMDDADLAQATGLALALVGVLMEGHGVLKRGEFSRHLANLAIVTRETDADQGDLLSRWAATAAQVGGISRRPPTM